MFKIYFVWVTVKIALDKPFSMRGHASGSLKNLLSFIVPRFQKLAGNSVDLDETAYNDLPHLDL